MTQSATRLIYTNARGALVGVSNGRCKFSEEIVAKARAMRAAGALLREITAAFGCSLSTAHDWTTTRRRRPHAKVVVKRGPPRGRLTPNRQLDTANVATARPAAHTDLGDTVAPTVKDVQP